LFALVACAASVAPAKALPNAVASGAPDIWPCYPKTQPPPGLLRPNPPSGDCSLPGAIPRATINRAAPPALFEPPAQSARRAPPEPDKALPSTEVSALSGNRKPAKAFVSRDLPSPPPAPAAPAAPPPPPVAVARAAERPLRPEAREALELPELPLPPEAPPSASAAVQAQEWSASGEEAEPAPLAIGTRLEFNFSAPVPLIAANGAWIALFSAHQVANEDQNAKVACALSIIDRRRLLALPPRLELTVRSNVQTGHGCYTAAQSSSGAHAYIFCRHGYDMWRNAVLYAPSASDLIGALPAGAVRISSPGRQRADAASAPYAQRPPSLQR
jgi:hypothetical protein